MSIRLLLIAAMLFLLVVMTDRHKSIRQKGGRSIVAALLLSFNVMAEMKQLSALSHQLSQYNVDKVYFLIKDVAYSLGLSSSALMSFQMFALSMVAMFALVLNERKSALHLSYPEVVVDDERKDKKHPEKDASGAKALRQPCIFARMLN